MDGVISFVVRLTFCRGVFISSRIPLKNYYMYLGATEHNSPASNKHTRKMRSLQVAASISIPPHFPPDEPLRLSGGANRFGFSVLANCTFHGFLLACAF